MSNAVAQAIEEGAHTGSQYITAAFEAGFFPITYWVYPFAHHVHAVAWPFARGTSFYPFLIAGIVAYPISILVGGLAPIE